MLKFDIVNFVCVVVNLLVLYVLMKKFVFGRVTKIIDARQALLEEKKPEEIALALGRPVKTIHTQLARGKRLLRQEWERRERNGTLSP